LLAQDPDVLYSKLLFSNTSVAERLITAQNAYLMYDILKDVIQRGTGIRAYNELRRNDIAGKTGTTNDRRDAWFSGFNNNIVVSTWVGFDQERSLGRLEQGARTALPMWIDFMREALYLTPESNLERPPGLIDVRIDPLTGAMTSDLNSGIFELFRLDEIPNNDLDVGANVGDETTTATEEQDISSIF